MCTPLGPTQTAAAPPTISAISRVIAAWRALLYWSCSPSMNLPALSVAAFMATIFDAISHATFSTAPRYTCDSM